MPGALLYSTVFFFCALVTGLYFTRRRWLEHTPDFIYARLPSTFADDVELGLTSDEFDLSENIEGGDSRAGLDNVSKRHIKRIMQRNGMSFNEARREYMEQRFASNNIGPDGRPRDPKFVSFS